MTDTDGQSIVSVIFAIFILVLLGYAFTQVLSIFSSGLAALFVFLLVIMAIAIIYAFIRGL